MPDRPQKNYLDVPLQMNLELTTSCPLKCPQCYVHTNTGENMELGVALKRLREGAAAGVEMVNLSGGETLCYPYLDELVAECRKLSLTSAVALSGAYATRERLSTLIDAGVTEIFVSLNGSTEEINSISRDGYDLAVHTLSVLRELSFPETYINFVMQRSNAHDLPAMASLAEEYGVKGLVVLAFKPDAAHEFEAFPTEDQLREAAAFIRNYRGSTIIDAEPCFSQLRAIYGKVFWGNRNIGIQRGCGAGRDGFSVDVKGRLTPCRHLDFPEEDTISSYWENSPVLKMLRGIEERREPPCKGCDYEPNCLPCAAVGVKLHGKISACMPECPLCR